MAKVVNPIINPEVDSETAEFLISGEWMAEWASREPHCWLVDSTNHTRLYEEKSPHRREAWTLFEVLEDGDERDICHVYTRGQLVGMLEMISLAASVK